AAHLAAEAGLHRLGGDSHPSARPVGERRYGREKFARRARAAARGFTRPLVGERPSDRPPPGLPAPLPGFSSLSVFERAPFRSSRTAMLLGSLCASAAMRSGRLSVPVAL